MIGWFSYSDYSNLCFEFSKSLNSIGVESECYSLTPHAFGYETNVLSYDAMVSKMKECDCIVVGHTQEVIFNMCKDLGKRIFVIHTGTIFRQEPEKFNAIFNPVVERTLSDTMEFYDSGCKNFTYVHAAFNTDKIKPDYYFNNRAFAHYPSKSTVKGTDAIKKVMEKINCNFVCDTSIVSHEKNLERISDCDIYIEMMSPMQGDKVYCGFGTTAGEAACLGKVVITNSLFHHVYEQTYGTPGELMIANTESDLYTTVSVLNSIKPIQILDKQIATRKWIEKYHSYQSTGYYLHQFFKP